MSLRNPSDGSNTEVHGLMLIALGLLEMSLDGECTYLIQYLIILYQNYMVKLTRHVNKLFMLCFYS